MKGGLPVRSFPPAWQTDYFHNRKETGEAIAARSGAAIVRALATPAGELAMAWTEGRDLAKQPGSPKDRARAERR